MLKGIPERFSPQLMKMMMEMGHGDELVIADGNFPAASSGPACIRADGQSIPPLLKDLLLFLPLDTYVEKPVMLMRPVEKELVPPIWGEYKNELKEYNCYENQIELLDRFDFYERASKAFAVISTSERSLYANIILKKGVVQNQ